ncbi:hypothetical protein BDY24DRAFT_123771 [Mrakia frigida]|uniref:uncharacterized protein n=1 Tax=Mrakia frigida TaxID=29902 RepID=UPI003FCC12BF
MSSASGSGARRRSVAPGGGSAASPVVKSSYGAPPDSSSTRRQSPVRHPSPSRSAISGRSGTSRTGGGVSTSNGRGGGRNGGDSDEEEGDASGSEASYDDQGNGTEPAAVRYARLKQRNQNTIGKNKVNGSSLNNTSVNIATAFNQAAGSSRSLHLSSASENERNPRKESHSPLPQASSSSSARRDFAMPPPPLRNNNNNNQYNPPQPDRRERAKSPVLDAIAGAARALSPVSYLLKPRVGVMNNQFPEDHEEEDDDEGPSYRSFGSALTSPNKSRANVSYNHHENASFLSATTANTSNGGGGASAESSYRFEEEERLMKEIEQSKGKGKEKEVEPPVASGSGWLSGLPGFSRSSPAPSSVNSPKKKAAPPSSKDSSYNPRAVSHSEESASSGSDDDDDSDEFDVGQEDQVTKTSSSSKRKPRVSHDNQAFKYKPGQSASEESESDGDGGRQKRKRRKSGKIGPLGAEGMAPVVEGKKRKGRKGKRSTKKNGASRMSSDEDEQEPDVSMDLPHQPRQDQSYDEDATMDFGNDNGDVDPRGQEEDDSFVVQMSSRAAAVVRGPATTSSNSKLPTHFKSSNQHSFVAVARDLLLSILRYLLVGLILAFNGLVTSLSWLFQKPAEIASGVARSLGLLDWSLASKAVAAAILLGTLAILLDQPTAPGAVRPPSESTSWIPSVHFNRNPGGKAYRTPDLPPESMDELIERLSHLETALGSLTSQAKTSDAKRTQVESHVVQLQDRISSDIKKVSTEAEKREVAEKERLQSLDRVVGKIRGDVDTLSGRVKKMGEQVDSDAKEIERLDDGAEVVRKELKSLGERVREAEKVAREASDASRIAKIATEAIESYLPSKLVVRMNPKTGSLDIDPSFWKALRAVFVEHGQVEPIVSSRIDKLKASLDASSSSVAKSSSPPPPAPVVSVAVPQVPSWKEFISSNEKALRAWSDSEHDRKADSGAVVSKKTFLEVLHRELESLKVTFEKQVNENIHHIGEEILSKSVAAGKAAAAVAHSGSKSSSSSSSSSSGKGDQTVTIKSSSGENISDLLTTMIDSALLKYSKDVLAKTDYALFTAGGRVIPSITTDTYEIKIKAASTWGRLVGGKKAATTIEGRAPAYALDPDIGVGNCWPFAGSKGQLGILLARKVLVTEITIEHAARAVSFDMDAAPRDVEVWGMVEGAENQAKVAAYQARKAEELANLPPGSELDEPVASLPPSPNYILLGSFTYDIDSPNHRQTFAVPEAIKELQVPTGIVVVRIGSNYGADYTCLYRVRVHGDAFVETDSSTTETA